MKPQLPYTSEQREKQRDSSLSWVLTCRVVAKWRRLPVVVAGWLPLEREKAMQVTPISNPLAKLPAAMPVLQAHPIFCEAPWNILIGSPWLSETVSLCTVNSQQHIQAQCFVTASETVLSQLLVLLHPSLLSSGTESFLGITRADKVPGDSFTEDIWANIHCYQLLCATLHFTDSFPCPYHDEPGQASTIHQHLAQRLPTGSALTSYPSPR